MNPNRIKIVFDGGIAEIYGDIFSDMLVCWSNQLFERQKAQEGQLAHIRLSDTSERQAQFAAICINYDDAAASLEISDQISKVFRHTNIKEPKRYVQPARE